MLPDGFDKLKLISSIEIAFNPAMSLLDGSDVTALLKVVNIFFGHSRATRQQLGHRMEIAQSILAHSGPHLSAPVETRYGERQAVTPRSGRYCVPVTSHRQQMDKPHMHMCNPTGRYSSA